LDKQAMIRPPPGTVPLQNFSKSPVQAFALRGGQLLRDGGLRGAQGWR